MGAQKMSIKKIVSWVFDMWKSFYDIYWYDENWKEREEAKKYGMFNIYLFNYENCLRYMKSEKFMQSQFFGIQVMCKNILLVFISLFKLVGKKNFEEKKQNEKKTSTKI